jgi:hypothetical protein
MDIILNLAVTFTFFLGCFLFVDFIYELDEHKAEKPSFVKTENFKVAGGACVILALVFWFICIVGLIWI